MKSHTSYPQYQMSENEAVIGLVGISQVGKYTSCLMDGSGVTSSTAGLFVGYTIVKNFRSLTSPP